MRSHVWSPELRAQSQFYKIVSYFAWLAKRHFPMWVDIGNGLGSPNSLGFYEQLQVRHKDTSCGNNVGPWKLQSSANHARLCQQHNSKKASSVQTGESTDGVAIYKHHQMHRTQQTLPWQVAKLGCKPDWSNFKPGPPTLGLHCRITPQEPSKGLLI